MIPLSSFLGIIMSTPVVKPFDEQTEQELFQFIRHGDDAHEEWLGEALTAFRLGHPKPPYVASKLYKTQVIFIDGPNAVGKTYFTENFEEQYRARFPDAVIHKFDASKYTFWQGRTERVHHTDVYPPDELRRMFIGHTQMIRDIKRDIVTNNPDLILVNRSLMTFNAYNLRYDHLDQDSAEARELKEMKELFNGMYEDTFKNYLRDVKTIYIGLTVFGDGVVVAGRRLKQRDYVKRVDDEHLAHLFDVYNHPSEGFRKMHTSVELIESGGFGYVLDKYFR